MSYGRAALATIGLLSVALAGWFYEYRVITKGERKAAIQAFYWAKDMPDDVKDKEAFSSWHMKMDQLLATAHITAETKADAILANELDRFVLKRDLSRIPEGPSSTAQELDSMTKDDPAWSAVFERFQDENIAWKKDVAKAGEEERGSWLLSDEIERKLALR